MLDGIDLRAERQWELAASLLPLYAETVASFAPRRYSTDNTWFVGSDAAFHALLLRHHRPARVVEVGCGYSSALLLDVDDAWDLGTAFTFIDPDLTRLRSLLAEGDETRVQMLERREQDVDLEVFASLAPGDMLLVDSSHVHAPGSDVDNLLTSVLPTLRPGTFVFFHDVFYPFVYPPAWQRTRPDITEASALVGLLRRESRYAVHLWNDFLQTEDPDWFAANMPACVDAPFPTGGLWLEVT